MLDEKVTTEVVVVLEDLAHWKLPERRWSAVAELVERLNAAIRSGEPWEVLAAADELELASPVRVTKIGEESEVPPPPFVLERRSEVLDSLRAEQRTGEGDERPTSR